MSTRILMTYNAQLSIYVTISHYNKASNSNSAIYPQFLYMQLMIKDKTQTYSTSSKYHHGSQNPRTRYMNSKFMLFSLILFLIPST